MGEKKKKKNSAVGRLFFILISTIILIYAFKMMFFSVKTVVIQRETVNDGFVGQGVITRDEVVTVLPKGANMKYYAQEGEKISKGSRMLEVLNYGGNDADIQIQIAELNARIAELSAGDATTPALGTDITKIDEHIFNKSAQIKRLIKNGNFITLTTEKNGLTRYLYKKTLVNGASTFFTTNIADLKKKKDDLEALYKKNYNVVYASDSGVVSYDIDDMEETLVPANIVNMQVSDFDKVMNGKDTIINTKKTGVKIVKDYKWYISIAINPTFAEGMEVGNSINIVFKENNDSMIAGNIFHISETVSERCIMTIVFDEYNTDFYKTRFNEIEIIKGTFSGYRVPQKVVIEKNGQKGVYVSRNQIARFIPISILTELESDYIIDDLTERNESMKDYAWLKQYDEIIINSKLVKENSPI